MEPGPGFPYLLLGLSGQNDFPPLDLTVTAQEIGRSWSARVGKRARALRVADRARISFKLEISMPGGNLRAEFTGGPLHGRAACARGR